MNKTAARNQMRLGLHPSATGLGLQRPGGSKSGRISKIGKKKRSAEAAARKKRNQDVTKFTRYLERCDCRSAVFGRFFELAKGSSTVEKCAARAIREHDPALHKSLLHLKVDHKNWQLSQLIEAYIDNCQRGRKRTSDKKTTGSRTSRRSPKSKSKPSLSPGLALMDARLDRDTGRD